MKVVIVNTVIGTGSVGRISCGIADEVKKRGGRALLCRGRGQEVPGYENYRVGCDADMYIHGILSRITDRQGLYSSAATKGLIRRIEEYDPDIIQLHNIHGYYLNYRLLFDYLKKSGRKTVWTLHDCYSFTGHCVHFEYRNCMKWESGECGHCPEIREYPASYLFDRSRENYGIKKEAYTGLKNLHLVTPSEYLKDKIERSFLAGYPVKVINTGIDLGVFKPGKESIREKYHIGDRILILGVANPWRERKGLYDFAKLYAKLDPDKYALALMGLKKKQAEGLPSGIIKPGRTDSIQEMAEWYRASDVYMNLTYEDTFPTTNIEALACGTPVVTYASGGSGEIIDKNTGVMTPKGDVDKALQAVDLFGRKKEEISRKCVEKAGAYNKDIKYNEYYELYKAL